MDKPASKPSPEKISLKDYLDLGVKSLVPLAIFLMGSVYTCSKNDRDEKAAAEKSKVERDQRSADRVSLLLKSLASTNEVERSLALQVADYLGQNDQLPKELVPVLDFLVNPDGYQLGRDDSAVTETDRKAIGAIRSQPGFAAKDFFWVYLGNPSRKDPKGDDMIFKKDDARDGEDTLRAQVDAYERIDIPRSDNRKWFKGRVCGMLVNGQKVVVKSRDTLPDGYIWANVATIPPSPRDYRVLFYGYKISWADYHKAVGYLLGRKYEIVDTQMITKKKTYVSDSPVVFYYSADAAQEAGVIAAQMGFLFGKTFPTRMGPGHELPKGKERWSIYVHYVGGKAASREAADSAGIVKPTSPG